MGLSGGGEIIFAGVSTRFNPGALFTHPRRLTAMNTTANLSAWPEDERDRKRAPARF